MLSYSFSFCCMIFLCLVICLLCCFFFFSSRRRHTRCLSDWSSDVCSSDLPREPPAPAEDRRPRAGHRDGSDRGPRRRAAPGPRRVAARRRHARALLERALVRSEEHTSELQSLRQLVCRLLLRKKNKSDSEP